MRELKKFRSKQSQNSEFWVHKPIIFEKKVIVQRKMQDLKIQKRKLLKAKIARVLDEDMLTLPNEMRGILLDDLVTAFENRLKALQKRKMDTEMNVMVANLERYEILQIS